MPVTNIIERCFVEVRRRTGNEFLFGPDILVAPAPYPDELQDYSVIFPPVPWYDYWTGSIVTNNNDKQVMKSNKKNAADVSTGAAFGMGSLSTVIVHPTIDLLPVYVRGGSILPIGALVQDTGQKSSGPLELRVYPGPECKGTLYQDDGTTFDYKQGAYLRVNYTCDVQSNNLRLPIAAQTGSFKPQWNEVQVAVYDWPSAQVRATLNGRTIRASCGSEFLRVQRNKS